MKLGIKRIEIIIDNRKKARSLVQCPKKAGTVFGI